MGFFDFLGSLGSLLQSVLQIIGQVILAIVKLIIAVFNFVWNTLVSFANFLHGIFQNIGKFFSGIWTNFLKPLWTKITTLYATIRKRLAAIFGPVLRVLQRLHDLYMQYVYKWVVLVEDLLSRIRVVLTLFRILGAKWAVKLDADIQRIQGYIAQFNAQIIGALNQAITWINIAIDPAGIIRKEFFSGTLFSSLGALKRATMFGAGRMLTGTELKHEAQDVALGTSPTGILTRNADGSVTLSDAVNRINSSASDAFDYYGRGPVLH